MGERIHKGCSRVYNEKKFSNLKEIINNSKEVFGNDPAFKFKNPETKEVICEKDTYITIKGKYTGTIAFKRGSVRPMASIEGDGVSEEYSKQITA